MTAHSEVTKGELKPSLEFYKWPGGPQPGRMFGINVCSCRQYQEFKGTNEKLADQLKQTKVKIPGEMIGVDFMGLFPINKA